MVRLFTCRGVIIKRFIRSKNYWKSVCSKIEKGISLIIWCVYNFVAIRFAKFETIFESNFICNVTYLLRTYLIESRRMLYSNLVPRAFSEMHGGKRPWHRLASSAISLVYCLTHLIYSKPYIHIFAWSQKLRVKLPTFSDLLSRCIT